MTTNDLAGLLESLGMQKFLPAFREHEVGLADLLLLSKDDFKQLVPAVGPRRRLLDKVEELRAAKGGQQGETVLAAVDKRTAAPLSRHAAGSRDVVAAAPTASLGGRRIAVDMFLADGSTGEVPHAVKVSGLPWDITRPELHRFFAAQRPCDITIEEDAKGKPTGYAFVFFESEEDAVAALARTKEFIRRDRYVVVRRWHGSPRDGERNPNTPLTNGTARFEQAPEVKQRTVFMGNCPADCSTDDVVAFLGADASRSLERIVWAVDRYNRLKGFGFLVFATVDAALAAVRLPAPAVGGQPVNLQLRMPPPPRPRGASPHGGPASNGRAEPGVLFHWKQENGAALSTPEKPAAELPALSRPPASREQPANSKIAGSVGKNPDQPAWAGAPAGALWAASGPAGSWAPSVVDKVQLDREATAAAAARNPAVLAAEPIPAVSADAASLVSALLKAMPTGATTAVVVPPVVPPSTPAAPPPPPPPQQPQDLNAALATLLAQMQKGSLAMPPLATGGAAIISPAIEPPPPPPATRAPVSQVDADLLSMIWSVSRLGASAE